MEEKDIFNTVFGLNEDQALTEEEIKEEQERKIDEELMNEEHKQWVENEELNNEGDTRLSKLFFSVLIVSEENDNVVAKCFSKKEIALDKIRTIRSNYQRYDEYCYELLPC